MLKADLSDWTIINFLVPRNNFEDEVIWLIGNYLVKVWNDLYTRNKNELNEEEFFGFLTFKFKEDQRGARKKMRDIQGLAC